LFIDLFILLIAYSSVEFVFRVLAGWLQARGLVAGAWSADWLQVCVDVRRHAFYHGFVCARVKGGVLTA
jgi:hypothetical protein